MVLGGYRGGLTPLTTRSYAALTGTCATLISAFIGDKSKSGIVAGRRLHVHRSGRIRAKQPVPSIGRKTSISIDRAVHIGNVQTGGQRHGLSINIGAAGDNDGVHAAAQRVAMRGGDRRVEAWRHQRAGRGEGGDARSRLTTMVVRPASGLPMER